MSGYSQLANCLLTPGNRWKVLWFACPLSAFGRCSLITGCSQLKSNPCQATVSQNRCPFVRASTEVKWRSTLHPWEPLWEVTWCSFGQKWISTWGQRSQHNYFSWQGITPPPPYQHFLFQWSEKKESMVFKADPKISASWLRTTCAGRACADVLSYAVVFVPLPLLGNHRLQVSFSLSFCFSFLFSQFVGSGGLHCMQREKGKAGVVSWLRTKVSWPLLPLMAAHSLQSLRSPKSLTVDCQRSEREREKKSLHKRLNRMLVNETRQNARFQGIPRLQVMNSTETNK